jgi:ABC-type oligopeptide transport system substrate-binding subunit/cell division protein FtsB
MKKFLTLAIMIMFVFTLSSCGNDDVIADLQSAVDNLQTQLNASDVDVADLEAAKDALDASVAQLQADLDAVEAENVALDAELAGLQADFLADISSLTDTITLLSTQLDDTAAEFDLAIQSANDQIAELLAQLAVFELPIIYGVADYTQSVYEDLDYKLSVFDIQEGDLSSKLIMTSPGTFDEVGTYDVTFEVTDGDGNVTEFVVVVEVIIPENQVANYLSGIDLGKLDTENKGILFAALENYLLDNVYGGVPLYRGASRVMYADRVSLFSPEYNGVMGFGTGFSELTLDDSNVYMYDEVYGNAGEYTWRASYVTDHASLNNWIADDSNSSDFIDLFTGSLYTFYFDASKTGYEILPDLASSEPIPVDPFEVNGKMYSDTYTIEIRDDLVWSFHEDTDLTGLPAGYEDLDANDYYDTWKYALENNWFRAVAGGGDFITNGVKNAAEFVAGTKDWEDVGIKLIDDNTIEITYVSDKTIFDVKYGLVGNWTPINMELFDDLGGVTGWAQGPDSIASSGVYQFEEYTSGQFYFFGKNDLHPNADMYNYTGRQYRMIADDETRFQEFLAGRLESASVPSARVSEYATDPRVEVAPDATTWRLQINGFGTVENRDAYIEQYPNMGIDESYTPEPILQYLEMRRALQFGFDRYEAAVNVVQTYLPAFTYFAPTYFLDAEGGISVRGTEAGQATVETYGAGTYGYVPDAAVAYFKEAVALAIAEGFYATEIAAATEADPFLIPLSLTYASSGNSGAQNMVAQLKQQYEDLLYDDVNFVGVEIVVADVAFPTNYYNFMMTGATDLGIGGISGSLLNAPSFLDTFNDDNRSGFTLNWGIDTHTPNIEVVYNGLDGVTVNETWSFNGLVAAMNGKEYIQDGVEQSVFDSADGLIDAYLDMAGTSAASKTDGADLAQYVLGSTVEQIAIDEGFDAVYAYIVVTADGGNSLFVISELDGGFELITQNALFTDYMPVLDGVYPVDTVNGMLVDDAAVAANTYLQGLGLTTLQEIADYVGAPVEYIEAYDVTWGGSYGGTDVYVMLHIGPYYIPWEWL